MGQPTPLGLWSSAHERACGARASARVREAGSRAAEQGVAESSGTRGGEASLVTWIWVLWTGGGSL